jgi:lipopolysaccharide transport system ATP-binding protein
MGMKRREIASKLDEIVAFSGLEDFIDTPVKRYSSGMYARLGFSVAAHVKPDVMIVDEVLSVGDFAFQRKCVERMKQEIRNGAAVVFVSHNLKDVAEFCSSCVLLEKGRTITTGPAQEVISSYLKRFQLKNVADASQASVTISKVTVRNQNGECLRFRSGEKAWIDVELRAHARCSKLSLTLYILGSEHQNIFDTSTERLGHGNFSLNAGDAYNCTFELELNLANGVFHPSILVYRYDTQTEFDRWQPAATIHVSSEMDVRGAAHCFPKVVQQEIRTGSEAALAEAALSGAASEL